MLNISTIFAHADAETRVSAMQQDRETVFVEFGSTIGIWLPFDKARELRDYLDAAIPLVAVAELGGMEFTEPEVTAI